jgi:hypothetical protein
MNVFAYIIISNSFKIFTLTSDTWKLSSKKKLKDNFGNWKKEAPPLYDDFGWVALGFGFSHFSSQFHPKRLDYS